MDGLQPPEAGHQLGQQSRSCVPRHFMVRSEEHTSELQSPCNLVCRLLLEKKTKFSVLCVSCALLSLRRLVFVLLFPYTTLFRSWLVMMAQAWLLTGDDRYPRAVTDALRSWMDSNPPKRGINWASSLEVAFRAISWLDRKSTRLNSSHLVISYAVFCLKKKQNFLSYVFLVLCSRCGG